MSASAAPEGYATIDLLTITGDADGLAQFDGEAFDGEERVEARTVDDDGLRLQAEVRVGTTTIVFAERKPDRPFAPSLLQVYVDDIDAARERALAREARLIAKPTDFFGIRFARIRDSSANIWWIWQHGEPVWEEPSGEENWTAEGMGRGLARARLHPRRTARGDDRPARPEGLRSASLSSGRPAASGRERGLLVIGSVCTTTSWGTREDIRADGGKFRMSEEWIRRAKTPETRTRIRRLNRWTNFFFWAGVLLVLGGIAFIVWSVATDRHSGPVFWGVIAGTVVVVLVCVVCGSHAGSRLGEARFADGCESVGTIVEVTAHPSVDGPETCDILVTASVSGVVIHRKIDGLLVGRVGDRIRFRHNTIDPEDVDDIRFEGWNGSTPRRSESDGSARQSRDLYVDAQVSVGRVVEVTSYPGSPGGNDPTDYMLMVSVELPESVTLRRRVYLAERQLRSSGPAFRPLIRLLHNTLDPENLSDAFFDGWVDNGKRE